MEALAITPGTGNPRLIQRAEPSITAADQIKIEIRHVGICGTDREEASGGRALAPDGQQELVIGHEMLGEVVEVGEAVTRVAPGDLAVLTVRHECGRCRPCRLHRPDMCLTGNYRERGIWGLDGYQTRFVVDDEAYAVRVPSALEKAGVLAEPLSVSEKAIDEAVSLQKARLPGASAEPNWLSGRRCLVAGLGPIGLLAALALRLRGAEVFGLDIVDESTARPAWLKDIGGHYVDGRTVAAIDIDEKIGPMELIVEAAGVAALGFNLIDALALGGAYVLTGIPGGNHPIEIPGAELARKLVLGNQLLVGSVNAARAHFQMAVDDLAQAATRWPGLLQKLITHQHAPEAFEEALAGHGDDEIKTVVDWAAGS